MGSQQFRHDWVTNTNIFTYIYVDMCFPCGARGKESPANAGDRRDTSSIPGSGRSPAGGHGNPLQYSCLENPMDNGTWRATVSRVAKSQTWLKWLCTHAYVGVLERKPWFLQSVLKNFFPLFSITGLLFVFSSLRDQIINRVVQESSLEVKLEN